MKYVFVFITGCFGEKVSFVQTICAIFITITVGVDKTRLGTENFKKIDRLCTVVGMIV